MEVNGSRSLRNTYPKTATNSGALKDNAETMELGLCLNT